jgi:hypothetical protein
MNHHPGHRAGTGEGLIMKPLREADAGSVRLLTMFHLSAGSAGTAIAKRRPARRGARS